MQVLDLDIFHEISVLTIKDRPQPTFVCHEKDAALLKELNLTKYRAVIAGGAALRWYTGQSVNNHDVDLWFTSDTDLFRATQHLSSIGTLRYNTPNAKTYDVEINKSSYSVQLINKIYPSVEEMLDCFDITVCKIATDGYGWWIGNGFSQDLKTKTLRMTHFKKGSMRRFVKYVNYGFEPEPTLLQRLLDDPVVNLDYANDSHEEYVDGL
jgi:hypothetical protein